MLLHMPHHLVDRLLDSYIPSLRSNFLDHPRRWHLGNHALGLRHRSSEQSDQLRPTLAAIGTELRIPHPDVSRSTHPMDYPLPRISAKMQNKISDSVFMRPLPLPNLFVTQLAQTDLKTLGHLIQP